MVVCTKSQEIASVQAEKATVSEQLSDAEVALKASRSEAAAATAEAVQLADQAEEAENRALLAEKDLRAHLERSAGGDADVEAMFQQLQAAQSSAAAVSAESAELRHEVSMLPAALSGCVSDCRTACLISSGASGPVFCCCSQCRIRSAAS